jgi:hypothetical protein
LADADLEQNVSPSAHRFKTLQKYLRDQAAMIGIPPEEEPQLESSVWLREHERNESPYRSNVVNSNGVNGYSGRMGYPQDYQPRMPNGYPTRATMYEASNVPSNSYDRQRYDSIEQLSVDPRRQPRVPAIQLDVRKGRGISSPGLLELSSQPASRTTSRKSPTTSAFRQDQQYNFTNDDTSTMDWDPAGDNSPLRPFSFAVWAGKNGGASSVRSSPGPGRDGNGRSSILGRWSGSVTSLFGGSQAGSHWGSSHGGNSGSMMDMQ